MREPAGELDDEGANPFDRIVQNHPLSAVMTGFGFGLGFGLGLTLLLASASRPGLNEPYPSPFNTSLNSSGESPIRSVLMFPRRGNVVIGGTRWSANCRERMIEDPGPKRPGIFVYVRFGSMFRSFGVGPGQDGKKKLPLLSATTNWPRISGAFGSQPGFRLDHSMQRFSGAKEPEGPGRADWPLVPSDIRRFVCFALDSRSNCSPPERGAAESGQR